LASVLELFRHEGDAVLEPCTVMQEWFPGKRHFREVTSMSHTTDVQARLGSRYRPEQGGPQQEVHALNGTAVTDRSLIG